jgi:hypothetical protein
MKPQHACFTVGVGSSEAHPHTGKARCTGQTVASGFHAGEVAERAVVAWEQCVVGRSLGAVVAFRTQGSHRLTAVGALQAVIAWTAQRRGHSCTHRVASISWRALVAVSDIILA